MQTKRKSTNFLKLGVLFFGVLFLWNCEKEDEQIALQNSLSEILQREFNSEEFKKTLPYKYEVDWSNPKKQFSEQLGTSFYEFPIVYTDAFNPETFNKQRKRDFYKKYKIVVAEKQDGKFDFFIARYYLKNNGENPDVENTIVGLNLNSGYNGTVHLYDKDGKMVFAKHVSRENKIEDFFLENKSDSLDDKVKPLAKWIRVCETITTYHYIDWYWVVTGRYGRVISSTFLYTTFEGTTQREECRQEWLPDNNNDDGCIEVDGRCAREYESQPIPTPDCQEGYAPDENGNCVRIPGPIETPELEEETITVDGPKNPIANMTDYLKCFDLNLGATITIYIDQPVANSDRLVSIGDRSGHTFVSISQNGYTSTFGFYPNGTASPFSPTKTSVMGDDSQSPYDVSVSVSVNSDTLKNVVNSSINYNSTYNLNDYNCTDFIIEIGNQCGLNLPDANRNWLIGGGSNPASLGQHIRNNFSPTGSQGVNTAGGTSPSNVKNCEK